MGREVEGRNIKEKKRGGRGRENVESKWKRKSESRRILSNISILGRNFKEEILHKKRYTPLHIR